MSDTVKEFSLDGTLDDIDDLPSFGAYPTGAFRVVLEKGIEFKKINDHPAMTAEMKLKEVLELDPKNLEEGENPPVEGDIATVAFLMDNTTGSGFYKNFSSVVYKHLGVEKHKDAIENSRGLELIVSVKRIHGKKANADRTFNQIVNVGIV